MFRKVTFNIFEENLQEIVYGSDRNPNSARQEKEERPARQPAQRPRSDFWRHPYISRYISKNQGSLLYELR